MKKIYIFFRYRSRRSGYPGNAFKKEIVQRERFDRTYQIDIREKTGGNRRFV